MGSNYSTNHQCYTVVGCNGSDGSGRHFIPGVAMGPPMQHGFPVPNTAMHLQQPPGMFTGNRQNAPSPCNYSPSSSQSCGADSHEDLNAFQGQCDGDSTPTQQPPPEEGLQYVYVHVDPGQSPMEGETQVIHGPAVYQWMSNNGPPRPMPMAGPPGQHIEQVVDENGVLTSVIVTNQMAPPYQQPPPAPPNSTPVQGSNQQPIQNVPPNNSVPFSYRVPPFPPPFVSGGAFHPPVMPPYPPQHQHFVGEHAPHQQPPVMRFTQPNHPPPPATHDAPPPCSSGSNPSPHFISCTINHSHFSTPGATVYPNANSDLVATSSSHSASHAISSVPEPHPRNDKRPPVRAPRHRNNANQNNTGGSAMNMPGTPHSGSSTTSSPRRSRPSRANGARSTSSQASGSNGHSGGSVSGDSEDTLIDSIREKLSAIAPPSVHNICARTALIQGRQVDLSSLDVKTVLPGSLLYDVQLQDKTRDNKFLAIYYGECAEVRLTELKPATDYAVKMSSHYLVTSEAGKVVGAESPLVVFRTLQCEPDQPTPPKMSNKGKTNITLKWNSVTENGSKITQYVLEMSDQGSVAPVLTLPSHVPQFRSHLGGGDNDQKLPVCFTEVYTGTKRQHNVTKLQPSTRYMFRLAAINSIGKSAYSEPVSFCTTGAAPSHPEPPMLSQKFVRALTISWVRRPSDEEFRLQMEDFATGHGFLNVFNGSDLVHTVEHLRRNTSYKFRLQALNDEGSSQWSDAVTFRTLPDRPQPPAHLRLHKNRVHSTCFRICWDKPSDNGGSEIVSYQLELDSGRGFDLRYEGLESDATIEQLLPGHCYSARVRCFNGEQYSDYTEPLRVETQAVAPCACSKPKLNGKAKSNSLHLHWVYPKYDGGAAVTQYSVLMTYPDSTTREVYTGRDLECYVAGLLPGRHYLFQVRAFNKAGAGPWSEILEVLSGPGVPDAPRAPEVSCRSAHSAVISWDEPLNNGASVNEYRLQWSTRLATRPVTASPAAAAAAASPSTSSGASAVATSSYSASAATDVESEVPTAAGVTGATSKFDDSSFALLYSGPDLQFDARNLQPATQYAFRVQALNSAGPSPFSVTSSCTTPPSVPALVPSVRASATAESVHLSWREPECHGSAIVAYNIDVGETPFLTTSGSTLSWTIDNLLPETSYKVRIQAVNGIGTGPFTAPVRISTHSLPPSPPTLRCEQANATSLKLRWGDSKPQEASEYCLEQWKNNAFIPVYQGSMLSHKINRLQETMQYSFRINSRNKAGDGPYSPVFKCSTTKAPPPAVKEPRVVEVGTKTCMVTWPAVKSMGRDTIVYSLQLQRLNCAKECSDQLREYIEVYRGELPSHKIDSMLDESTEYQVRVCAHRVSQKADTCSSAPATPPGSPAKVVEVPASPVPRSHSSEKLDETGDAVEQESKSADVTQASTSQERPVEQSESVCGESQARKAPVEAAPSEVLSGAFSPGVRFQTKRVQQVVAAPVSTQTGPTLCERFCSILLFLGIDPNRKQEYFLVMLFMVAFLVLCVAVFAIVLPSSYYDPGPVEESKRAWTPPPVDHDDHLELRAGDL